MRIFAALFLLIAAACQRDPSGASGNLMSQVRAKQAERDRKLNSYHLVSSVHEGAREAKFEFFFRSPNRMRGVLLFPETALFSFDGERLFQHSPAQKKFDARTLSGTSADNALTLNKIFGPFAPEGFRAPLFLHQAEATFRVHPLAPQAVEVRQMAQEAKDPARAQITYVLRWPSLDFLEKTIVMDGSSSSVRVETEQCDAALGLCVPTRISQWANGQKVGLQEISAVELNPPLPEDSFRLLPNSGSARVTAPEP